MIRQVGLVDVFVVIRLANEVYDRLDYKPEQHQNRHQDQPRQPPPDPRPHPLPIRHHHREFETQLNREEQHPQNKKEHNRNPHLPLDQRLALTHSIQTIALFQNRDHSCQMPDHGYIQQANQVTNHKQDQEDRPHNVNRAEYHRPQYQHHHGNDIIREDDEEIPYEGDDEALPDLGDDAEDLDQGDFLGGVDAGDGVDDGGGGEEGEEDEEDEVADLEEEEGGPLGEEDGGDPVVGGAAVGGPIEHEFVEHDLGEEEVGDLDVG